jgi:hypothetical protein
MEDLAGRCVAHLAAGSLKEADSELVLKLANLVADRSRRDTQLTGGAGEAHVPAGGFQRLESIKARKAIHGFFNLLS